MENVGKSGMQSIIQTVIQGGRNIFFPESQRQSIRKYMILLFVMVNTIA